MAYGARLESVLGESPRGFESPILRRGEGPVTCGNVGGGPFVVGASEAARPRWVAVLVAVRRASKASGARLGSENGRHLPRPDTGDYAAPCGYLAAISCWIVRTACDAAGPYSMVRIESGSVPPRNAWYSASSSSTRGGAARSSLPHPAWTQSACCCASSGTFLDKPGPPGHIG